MTIFRNEFKKSLRLLSPILNTIRYKSNKAARRRSGNRHNCVSILDVYPRCHPNVLDDCVKELKKEQKMISNFPFAHLVQNPDCCDDPCKDMYARFDDMYYWPSDKAKRCYRRTWAECKSPLCKEKKFCCEYKPLCIEKRCPKEVKGVACEMGNEALNTYLTENKDCRQITMPCCKPVRKPPKCHRLKSLSNCYKICPPYPSYSECKKPKIRLKARRECECLEKVDLCTIYELLRMGKLEVKKRFKLT